MLLSDFRETSLMISTQTTSASFESEKLPPRPTFCEKQNVRHHDCQQIDIFWPFKNRGDVITEPIVLYNDRPAAMLSKPWRGGFFIELLDVKIIDGLKLFVYRQPFFERLAHDGFESLFSNGLVLVPAFGRAKEGWLDGLCGFLSPKGDHSLFPPGHKLSLSFPYPHNKKLTEDIEANASYNPELKNLFQPSVPEVAWIASVTTFIQSKQLRGKPLLTHLLSLDFKSAVWLLLLRIALPNQQVSIKIADVSNIALVQSRHWRKFLGVLEFQLVDQSDLLRFDFIEQNSLGLSDDLWEMIGNYLNMKTKMLNSLVSH